MKDRALFAGIGGLLVLAGVTLFFLANSTPPEPPEPSVVVAADPHADADAHVAFQGKPEESAAAGEPLADFELTNQQGKTFQSADLRGKVWVGSIFFADCPSVCRQQNQRISELQRKFVDRGVEFVSVTCDPTHDTPQRLAEYSALFNAIPEKWHFLTGDLDLIKRVGREKLGIAVDELVHSDRLVVFDRQGKIAGSYRSTDTDDFLKAIDTLEALLAAPEEAAGTENEPTENPPATSSDAS